MNPEVLSAIPIAVLFLAAFLGVGGFVLRVTDTTKLSGDALRLTPVAAAIGFAVLSYVAYLLIGFRVANPTVVAGVLVAGVVSGYRYWIDLASDLRSALRGTGRDVWSPVPLVFLILSAGFLLLVSTHWFTPPREGDALSGYMFTARWLRDRGLIYSAYNSVYQLYPFNTEMIFALTLAFGNDVIPKALDGLMGMCLLAALYEFARRYTDRMSSFLAPAHLAVMSSFAGIWASGKVDVLSTLTFVSGAALLFRQAEPLSWKTMALAAFLVGTACAQKYTLWVFGGAFLLALALFLPAPPKKRVLWTAGAAAVMAVCLLPHFAKTVAWTGNPVAPFARTIFPTTGVYLDPIRHSDALRMSASDLVTLPARLFWEGVESRRPGPFPWLLLIGLPFCAMRSTPRSVRRLAAVAAVMLVAWIAVRQSEWLAPRFLLVPTALLLVAAAVGVGQAGARSTAFRWSVIAMTAFTIGYAGIWQNRDWRRSWRFILGYEDRATWYDRITPGRAYSALTNVADHLSNDRRLFLYAGLYYIPDDKLEYISTEEEVAGFFSLPNAERLTFLRQRCFGFVHLSGKVRYNPSWTRGLPIVAQWNDTANGLEYTLFQVDSDCRRHTVLTKHTTANDAP